MTMEYTSLLVKLVTSGVTFHADSLDRMLLKSKADTWLIEIEQGGPVLYHNNYVKLSETERYIVDGFHKQKINSKSV